MRAHDTYACDVFGPEGSVVEPPAQRRPAPADIAGLLDQIADIVQARETQEWRRRAACRGKPTWVFFPGRHDYVVLRAALAICRSCPVRSECLAAHMGEPDGIWGGTSGKQRRAMRRGVSL